MFGDEFDFSMASHVWRQNIAVLLVSTGWPAYAPEVPWHIWWMDPLMWWLGRIQYCQTPIPLNTRTDDYTWRQTGRTGSLQPVWELVKPVFQGAPSTDWVPTFSETSVTRGVCVADVYCDGVELETEREGGRGEYKREERRWTGKREKCAFKWEGERESRVIVAGYSVKWYLVIWKVIIVHCVVGGFIQQDYSYYLWKSSQRMLQNGKDQSPATYHSCNTGAIWGLWFLTICCEVWYYDIW